MWAGLFGRKRFWEDQRVLQWESALTRTVMLG